MDAPEGDLDIKLQKISGDLIAELDRALGTALRKPDGHGGTRVRSFVRERETFRSTIAVLDMFQELPQLLDPQLPKWIPFLAESYLEYTQMRHRIKRPTEQSDVLVPVDYVISRILYSFCKVRGEKVIVRFLNVEPCYLEVLLSAIEEAEEKSRTEQNPAWKWEQRYVVLLWLSHLMLAPFDLSTISTTDVEESAVPGIKGLQWPQNLPGIATKILPLAIKYLSSPGKEKDAAKALLVRVVMRRDMQQLGVLDALVRWAMASLRPKKDDSHESTYFYLGVLSFLAGALRSAAETSDMDPYLAPIFHCMYDITLAGDDLSRSINKLALVRKMILKVVRSVTVSLLRLQQQQQQQQQTMVTTEMTETAIGYLLDSIADNDTPVRLSASKALSVVTLKLSPDMASQVVDAVLDSLNKNVLWTKPSKQGERPVRNLSSVNNLEWHGLMLTLSHLLYRRSPPAKQLSDIVHALLLGLSFEQRSTTGGSVGANVRDAACFGVWALARRYATQELLGVPTTSVFAAKAHPSTSSILQVLGTELIATACLDPAGNIRRGASAALQELIGRHPDTVERGIEVVQTVDYHMVARRSRAVEEVARKVTSFSGQYGKALIDGLLGWRGVGDMDARSRRIAGTAFGALTAKLCMPDRTDFHRRVSTSIDMLMGQTRSLAKRQVEERHGLLLCFSSLLDEFVELNRNERQPAPIQPSLVQQVLTCVSDILEDCQGTEYRRPELIAEGASCLVVSALPMIQLAYVDPSKASLQRGKSLFSAAQVRDYVASALCELPGSPENKFATRLTTSLQTIIPKWLSRHEAETVESAAAAALILVLYSPAHTRELALREWVTAVGTKPTARTVTTGQGYFHALAMAQPILKQIEQGQPTEPDSACGALLRRWSADNDVDVRVTIMQSLVRSSLLHAEASTFLSLLTTGLNDYTTTARGDVGSHIRLQALRAVRSLWETGDSSGASHLHLTKESKKKLFQSTLRLSAEKLDRVRAEAQSVLALMMKESDAKSFQSLTFSSEAYFTTLLELVLSPSLPDLFLESAARDRPAWMAELMSGYVTSADAGNDDLVIASRASLAAFCQKSQLHLDVVSASLALNLRSFPTEDRVAVPTLEIIAFLFHVGLFQTARSVNARQLYQFTRAAGHKTGNVRKIVACVKVYGGIAGWSPGSKSMDTDDDDGYRIEAGVGEAWKRLGALMSHPWPRVRSAAVDEIWGVLGCPGEEGQGQACLTGRDWSAAGKAEIQDVINALKMN